MWIKYNFDPLNTNPKTPTGLTIGAFDGVHLGHQALIRWMTREAHAAGLQAIVLTFDPLPWQVLTSRMGEALSTLDERLTFMEPLGVDGVIVLPFTQVLAATSALDFISRLRQHIALHGLWLGADFSLGRAHKGNVRFLRQLGRTQGFVVHTFEQTVLWDEAPVRSSRIRHAIKAGNVAEAQGCLGRPYRLCGAVEHGDHRGHTLGFPTANLAVAESRLLPARGVYICQAHLRRGTFPAITNVGTRPTFNHRPPTVEAYLLDFSADIYDEPIQLDFLHWLRPEVKFSSAETLIEQMQRDEAEARSWLQAHPQAQPELACVTVEGVSTFK